MTRTLKFLPATVAIALAMGSPAWATTRPAVLELFTSEGCSSCPPAEVLVNELAQRPDVLPLSFHVDYWDGLGWRDRYSLAGATARQRAYARAMRSASVYTPQAVIDGVHDVVGSQRDAVTRAVSGPREGVPTAVNVDHGELQIAVGAVPGAMSADVLLVGYLRQAITNIGRGENSGRTLTESNIVRSVQVLGRWDGNARDFRFAISSLPEDVTHAAVLVQSTGQGAILGAAAPAGSLNTVVGRRLPSGAG